MANPGVGGTLGNASDVNFPSLRQTNDFLYYDNGYWRNYQLLPANTKLSMTRDTANGRVSIGVSEANLDIGAMGGTLAQSKVANLTTDLAGKAATTHTHAIANVTNLQTTLDGKAAAAHTHTSANITDWTEATQDVIGSTIKAGANVTVAYDDTAGTMTINSTATGGSATNLGNTPAVSTIALTSSSGTGTTLPSATTSLAGVMTGADKTKLDGIASGATANATDAQLRDRSTHTGTQATSTVTGLDAALAGKAADSSVVHLAGTESITGLKTFTASPVVPTPTTSAQAANKSYVDDQILTVSPVGTDDGTRLLDSFAGATDDDKLTAAIAWQKAHTRMPAIRLASRVHTFNVTRQLYSGLKIVGTPAGPRNLEQSSGVFVPTRINLGASITSGTSSWWVTPGTNLFDIYMADFAVQGNQGASVHQFIDVTSGTLYACQFHALSFNFMRGVFGIKERKCLMTQVIFSGHWTANNLWDTQFHIGGADNNLWMDGYLNIGPSSSPAQTGSLANNDYELLFDSLTKTNIGYIFMSALNGWRGLKVTGSNAHGLRFFGGTYEGYKGSNDTLAAPGTVIRLEGGAGAFFSPSVGQGMQSPDTANEKGLIHMTGGEWAFYSPSFYRLPVADTTPMIYQSGGRLTVHGATRNEPDTWTTRPRYLLGGSVVTGPNSGENVFYCPDMSMTSA